MNYYNCDHITWKASLSLMKSDPNAQRVYSNLYQMTRDVLMTALTISAVASLTFLTIGLIKIGIEHLTNTPIMDSISVTILFSILCPAIIVVPLAWVLSYFGFYRNIKKIHSLMNHFIVSFPDAERVEPVNPVSYTIYYRGHEFIVLYQEHPTASLRVGKGKVILLIPYLDTKEGRTIEMLSEEIIEYLEGKSCAPSGMNDTCIVHHFPARPVPSPIIKGTADTMAYLMERFNLVSPTKEKAEERKD